MNSETKALLSFQVLETNVVHSVLQTEEWWLSAASLKYLKSETFDCEAGENVLRPFPPEKSALETVKTWEIETTEITKIRCASRRST